MAKSADHKPPPDEIAASNERFLECVQEFLTRQHEHPAETLLRKMEQWREQDQQGPKPKRKKRKKRRATTSKIHSLTEKQTEAMLVVGECKGNLADAARRIGIDRKSLVERFEAACKKLGKSAVKHATRSLPRDRRGQVNVKGGDRRLL